MEGRYPNGLLLAVTDCNDLSKEEEFNYWYNHIHIPDVTAPGSVSTCHALRQHQPRAWKGQIHRHV